MGPGEIGPDLDVASDPESLRSRRKRFDDRGYRESKQLDRWSEPAGIDEKKEWIQDAEEDIERRGTEGVCTGKKFGGPTCRKGTKRYNLAKTFRKMAKKRKGKKKI